MPFSRKFIWIPINSESASGSVLSRKRWITKLSPWWRTAKMGPRAREWIVHRENCLPTKRCCIDELCPWRFIKLSFLRYSTDPCLDGPGLQAPGNNGHSLTRFLMASRKGHYKSGEEEIFSVKVRKQKLTYLLETFGRLFVASTLRTRLISKGR